jgi:hypothetical protein
VVWNKPQKGFDLKLVPHWSAEFCPFPDSLCGCSKQGENKVGQYDLDGNYTPRKGFEDVWAVEKPTDNEYRKKRAQVEKDTSNVSRQA